MSYYAKRKTAATITGISLATASLLFAAPETASAQPTCHVQGTSWQGTLRPGNCIRSSNNKYTVVMQGDGNLVLYTSASFACWSTHTNGHWPYVVGAILYRDDQVWRTSYSLQVETWHGGKGSKVGASFNDINASINTRGEFWVGYTRVGHC